MTETPGPGSRRLTLIAATFTAFAEDGSVDTGPIETQAARLVEDGVHGAFVCGSSGEGASLTSAERVAVARRWCDVAPPGLRVIVHVGHTSLPEARALAEQAQAAGAHAVAAVPPFYFLPADLDQLIECCAEIASAAPRIPFIYYHIPAKTGVRTPMPEFIRAARARIPNFGGVKFTHTDLVEMARCVEVAAEGPGEPLEVFSGPDELLVDAMLAGVRAAVGSTYNYAAPLFKALGDAFDAGDIARAIEHQTTARRIIALAQRFGGLPAFKALYSLGGPDVGRARLPYVTLTEAQRTALHQEAASQNLLAAIGAKAEALSRE